MKKLLLLFFIIMMAGGLFFVSRTADAAPLCDESGDGSNPGTAVNINFERGLVPCGREVGKAWIYVIETTIPASSSPGPASTSQVTFCRGLSAACCSPVKTDNQCASDAMRAKTNPTYTPTPAPGNPNFPDFQCTYSSQTTSFTTSIPPLPIVHFTYICIGQPTYIIPASTTVTRGVVFADDEAAATVAANAALASMPPGPGTSRLTGPPSLLGETVKCRCELSHVFVLIKNLYDFIIRYLALPIAALLIVIGGILILLSGFNQNWYTTGKNMIFWAIMAVLIILAAWVIVNIIMAAVGYSGAWQTFPL